MKRNNPGSFEARRISICDGRLEFGRNRAAVRDRPARTAQGRPDFPGKSRSSGNFVQVLAIRHDGCMFHPSNQTGRYLHSLDLPNLASCSRLVHFFPARQGPPRPAKAGFQRSLFCYRRCWSRLFLFKRDRIGSARKRRPARPLRIRLLTRSYGTFPRSGGNSRN